MTIESKNGKGSIEFSSDRFNQDTCARVLIDWINIEFIGSVAIATDERANGEDLATICNDLLEITDKIDSLTIYPTLTLV